MEKKKRVHFVDKYILNPPHRLSVAIIGCGGTGSNMLSNLAAMDKALVALGHPGLHVIAFDDDRVTEANAARQLFYQSDIGLYKAEVLISRINRAFGTTWIAIPAKYGEGKISSNITISCVDTIKARNEINNALNKDRRYQNDSERAYYWMDCGNGEDYGQVVIGTERHIEQPESEFDTTCELKSPINYFSGLKDKKSDGPSCSLAEALEKQDLMVNKFVAVYAAQMLWRMFREGKLYYQGIYFNLSTNNCNPIQL